MGPTVNQDLASFDDAFAANVRAPYFLTSLLVPGMIARGGGSVISVTTMAASIGIAGMSIYGATKAALEALTRAWAAEFAADHIRVNTVAPGPTLTSEIYAVAGDAAEDMGKTTPMRSASPKEIAEIILFLASERSSYMTGATVAADGGRTAG
jgi:NAD(P)-dependent dehydrogenase (short-subunit alcohol dehydrogenase family)